MPSDLAAYISWLIGEVEEWRLAAGAEANLADERHREIERLQRFEAMWEDCRKQRKQAEGRAARYREIVQGVANLLIANEEASPP